MKRHRLARNVARYAPLPPENRAERQTWTAAQAVAFLDHCHEVDDPTTDLFEVIIGTELRHGEALALRWPKVDLTARALLVDRTAASSPT